MSFSLLLYLQLKLAKRELLKFGNEEAKTLTFGKQNHNHGHVCCIYFHSFVLGIREDGKQRGIGLGNGPYSLSMNSTSFYVSAMSDNNKFQFSMGISDEDMSMLTQSALLASDFSRVRSRVGTPIGF